MSQKGLTLLAHFFDINSKVQAYDTVKGKQRRDAYVVYIRYKRDTKKT